MSDLLLEELMAENNAVVVGREILEDDRIAYTLHRVIRNVPEDVTVDSLKRLMEGVGAYSHDDWKYAYKVVFQDDLNADTYGDVYNDMKSWIENKMASADESVWSVHCLTYDDFVDALGEEKRVTLRVPMGLHTMLVSASKGKSLNTFCMEVLSKTVGFEGVPVASSTKKD